MLSLQNMPPKRKNQAKKVVPPAKMAKEDEQPAVQFCVVDGPKNLGTLPQVPMHLICKHLAADGDYDGLINLLKVSFFSF